MDRFSGLVPYVGGYPANPLDNLYSKDMYIIAH
jgi:oligopeptide transport system substrate-binding protein